MSKALQTALSYGFGVIFVIVMLVIALAKPEPSTFQYTIFKTVLALACAGVVAVFPGFIEIKFGNWLRAGGALAVFMVLYFYSPAKLIDEQKTKGFVQFGDAWFHTPKISVSEPLSINLSMVNKGGEPVNDLYPYFAATVTPTGSDPDATDRKTHADFLKGALKYQEQLLNDGKTGHALGKGESLWSTMTFPPLNNDQVNGVMAGQVRLYVYAWARWRDAPRDLDTCIWLQPPPTPDVSDFKKLIWHTCME